MNNDDKEIGMIDGNALMKWFDNSLSFSLTTEERSIMLAARAHLESLSTIPKKNNRLEYEKVFDKFDGIEFCQDRDGFLGIEIDGYCFINQSEHTGIIALRTAAAHLNSLLNKARKEEETKLVQALRDEMDRLKKKANQAPRAEKSGGGSEQKHVAEILARKVMDWAICRGSLLEIEEHCFLKHPNDPKAQELLLATMKKEKESQC